MSDFLSLETIREDREHAALNAVPTTQQYEDNELHKWVDSGDRNDLRAGFEHLPGDAAVIADHRVESIRSYLASCSSDAQDSVERQFKYVKRRDINQITQLDALGQWMWVKLQETANQRMFVAALAEEMTACESMRRGAEQLLIDERKAKEKAEGELHNIVDICYLSTSQHEDHSTDPTAAVIAVLKELRDEKGKVSAILKGDETLVAQLHSRDARIKEFEETFREMADELGDGQHPLAGLRETLLENFELKNKVAELEKKAEEAKFYDARLGELQTPEGWQPSVVENSFMYVGTGATVEQQADGRWAWWRSRQHGEPCSDIKATLPEALAAALSTPDKVAVLEETVIAYLTAHGPCDDAEEDGDSGLCGNEDCTYCALEHALKAFKS